MSLKMTDCVTNLLEIANREAMSLNHDHIGCVHVLLAMTGDRFVKSLFIAVGLNHGRVKKEILETITVGPDLITFERLPQTLDLKRCIENAKIDAIASDSLSVGCEHLFSAILSEAVRNHVAGQVLRSFGINATVAREIVKEFLEAKGRDTRAEEALPSNRMYFVMRAMDVAASNLRAEGKPLTPEAIADFSIEIGDAVFRRFAEPAK